MKVTKIKTMNNRNLSSKDKYIFLNGKLESYIDSYNHLFTKLTNKMGTSHNRSLLLTNKEFTEYNKRYISLEGRNSELNNEANDLKGRFPFLIRAKMDSYRDMNKKYQALIDRLDSDIKMIKSLLDSLYKDREKGIYKTAEAFKKVNREKPRPPIEKDKSQHDKFIAKQEQHKNRRNKRL